MAIVYEIFDFGDPAKEAARLRGVSKRALNLTPALLEIVVDMFRIEDIVFTSQGRRGGGGWKRLSLDTVRKKGMTRILFTGGARLNYKKLPGDNLLYKSLTQPEAPYQHLKVYKQSIHFGTNRPWAFVHQHGSARKNIPARPFFKFIVSDQKRWADIIGRHVTEPHRIP